MTVAETLKLEHPQLKSLSDKANEDATTSCQISKDFALKEVFTVCYSIIALLIFRRQGAPETSSVYIRPVVNDQRRQIHENERILKACTFLCNSKSMSF